MGLHDGHRQRAKERYGQVGADALADHELLELALFYAIPRQDTNETAHRLLKRFRSLQGVLQASPEELEQVEGVGKNAALLLHLMADISQRARITSLPEKILNSPDRTGAYFMELLTGQKRELLYQVCLDGKGKLLTCRCIAKGTVSASAVHVRQVVENALYAGASTIILAHNHPSGVAVPSSSDEAATRQVAEALREDTVLVSMMLVNNETGCIFPVAEVAQLLKAKKSRALLHTDAVQAFLKIPFRADTLGADLISVSAHKLGAPKGIGGLYLGERIRAPKPLIFGGGQESGLRSGTEATGQIAGFAKAVELRADHLDEKLAHVAAIKAYAEEKLLALDGVVRIGDGTAPHILSISLVGYPSANVVTELGAQGICISAGSACHRGQLSHVYRAMGLDKRTAAGVLRVSFSPETTKEEIDALVSALKAHRDTRFPML